jgi:prepilin-type N-terminal cleavage/methylation domain-containing protein
MLNLNCKAVDNPIPKIQTAIAIYLSSISKKGRSNQEAGFSLIEALVAVAVVSILIVSIAPMVALSTSARVNARRTDQATQAGRSYIDAVRGGVIDTTNFPATLIKNQPNSQGQYVFEDPNVSANSIQAPTTTSFPPSTICNNPYPPAPTPSVNNVLSGKVPGICVDANGNGFSINDPQDLFIQPMRSGSSVSADLKTQGFWLAVRVYRADALAGTAALRTGTEASCAQSKMPFSSTASITCPIVTMRSQIFPTVNANNLNSIKTGIGSTP